MTIPTAGKIVKDLCSEAGVTDVDTTAIDAIEVRVSNAARVTTCISCRRMMTLITDNLAK